MLAYFRICFIYIISPLDGGIIQAFILIFPSNDTCRSYDSLMTMNVWISTLRFSAGSVIRTQEGKQTLHCVMEGIVQGAMSQFLL